MFVPIYIQSVLNYKESLNHLKININPLPRWPGHCRAPIPDCSGYSTIPRCTTMQISSESPTRPVLRMGSCNDTWDDTTKGKKPTWSWPDNSRQCIWNQITKYSSGCIGANKKGAQRFWGNAPYKKINPHTYIYVAWKFNVMKTALISSIDESGLWSGDE